MSILADLADQVPKAAARLRGVAHATPVQRNIRLSAATGSEIWLKREDLQPVRSYKLRGAHNLMAQLDADERSRGAICASAGNHGQGVAFAAATLGMRAIVVVPTTTPRQKRERIQALGRGQTELMVFGTTYDEASDEAKRLAEQRGMTLVPAFDDPRTAAGQATIIPEAIEQLGFVPDVVVLPIGGGGLAAGAAAYLRTVHPEVRIIGVEPDGAPCAAAALSAGRPVTLPEIDTFVDGAAVRRVGDFTFDALREARIELFRVPEGQICSEMLAMYQTDGIIAEPAGALAPAALPTGEVGRRVQIAPGARVLTFVSGGNNDVSRYAEVVERSLIHEGRKRYFLVDFPQKPGALRLFLDSVLGENDDITYFEYVKRNNRETGPALVGVELGNPDDYRFLLNRIDECGMKVEEVSYDSPFFQFLT